MATQPTQGSAVAAFPTAPLIPAAARILGRYDRAKIEAFAEISIALLDLWDGDPDVENATDLEDDFALSPLALGFETARGPGCAISDGRGDQAYVEWDKMRASQKRGPNFTAGEEDDELAGDETDGNFAEDDAAAEFAHIRSGPGCTISDSDYCSAGEDGGVN